METLHLRMLSRLKLKQVTSNPRCSGEARSESRKSWILGIQKERDHIQLHFAIIRYVKKMELVKVSHLLLQMEMGLSHYEFSAPESDEIVVKIVIQLNKTDMLQEFKIYIKYKFIHWLIQIYYLCPILSSLILFRSRSSSFRLFARKYTATNHLLYLFTPS